MGLAAHLNTLNVTITNNFGRVPIAAIGKFVPFCSLLHYKRSALQFTIIIQNTDFQQSFIVAKFCKNVRNKVQNKNDYIYHSDT